MNKPRARTPWSRRRWVLVIGAVLLAIALVAGVVLWNASRTPAGPTTDVVRATRTDETTTVSLAGVLAPQQQANVSFAVPGTVRTIDVKVGDIVLYSKYGGTEVKYGGDEFLVLSTRDVLAVVER